jgi:hypothetical protein
MQPLPSEFPKNEENFIFFFIIAMLIVTSLDLAPLPANIGKPPSHKEKIKEEREIRG